ncbi:hypothetical protein BH10PSE11_BH10PSE11_15610 [soil metagenome]
MISPITNTRIACAAIALLTAPAANSLSPLCRTQFK